MINTYAGKGVTVLEYIKNLKLQKYSDEMINKNLAGKTLVTQYFKNIRYRIDELDYTKTPLDGFMKKSSKKVKKGQMTIKDK